MNNSNPETPKTPREELELKLTALLLGELPRDQAFLLQEIINRDPELARLSERLKQTIAMVRETEHPTEEVSGPESKTASAPEPLKMAEEKRQKLLAHFKTVKPVEFEEKPKTRVSFLAVAALIALSMILASMLLPALSKAKSRGQHFSMSRSDDLASSRRVVNGTPVATLSAPSVESPYFESKNPRVSNKAGYQAGESIPLRTQDGADFATPSGQDEGRRSLTTSSRDGDHFVSRYSFKPITLPDSKDDAAVAAMSVPREPQSAKTPDVVSPSTFALDSTFSLDSAAQVGTKVDPSGNRKLGRVELTQLQESSQNKLAYQWGNQDSLNDAFSTITPKPSVNDAQVIGGGYVSGAQQTWNFGTGNGLKSDVIKAPSGDQIMAGRPPREIKIADAIGSEAQPTPFLTPEQLQKAWISPPSLSGQNDGGIAVSSPNSTVAGKPSTPAQVMAGDEFGRFTGGQGGGGAGPAAKPASSREGLIETLPTSKPDAVRNALTEQEVLARQHPSNLQSQYGASNPEVAKAAEVVEELRRKVGTREAVEQHVSREASRSESAGEPLVLGDKPQIGQGFFGPETARTIVSVTNMTASPSPSQSYYGGGAFSATTPIQKNSGLFYETNALSSAPVKSPKDSESTFNRRNSFRTAVTKGNAENIPAITNMTAISEGVRRGYASKSDTKAESKIAPTTGLPVVVADSDLSLAEPQPGSSSVQNITKSIPGRPLRMPDVSKTESPHTLEELQQVQQALSMKLAADGTDSRTESAQVQIVDRAEAKQASRSLGGRLSEALSRKVDRSARIKIDGNQPEVTFASPPAADMEKRGSYDPYFKQNEFEAIRSEAVLGKAAEKLGLNKQSTATREANSKGEPTKQDAIAQLRAMIDVNQVPNTPYTEIHAKAEKPEEAAKVANAVAEAYREARAEQALELSRADIKALEGRFNDLNKRIAKLQTEQQVAAQPKEAEPPAPPKSASTNAPIPQPEIQTTENAFSTFSLNVSDVSFKLAGASLEKGQLPDPAGIRSEEFINAFDYRDPEPPAGVPIGFAWERARYPFAQNRDLLRFSIKTAAQGRQAGRPLNLVLLLDNSGSMERADRVQIIHEALKVLAAQLNPQDTLSVVTFARTARLWVDGVPGSQAAQVAEDLSGLSPEGGTNLEEAMRLAYDTARRHYLPAGINRVVLLTDGAANLGNVEPEQLKQSVEAHRKEGIALDCFGIGWEGFNDDLLEVLSRNGDGRYGFINSPEEAATEFAGQLAGALQVAASDVKVQVEFNPARVTAYRQIGYAKHQLTKEQFRDNTVDAAEIAAAEAGNALYVIESNPAGNGPLATVRVRYKVPGTTDYREHEWPVPFNGNAVALEQASPAMRLAASASAFSEWLASSPYAGEVSLDRLLGYLSGVPAVYGADVRPQKLEWMIRQASSLAGK